MVVRTGFTVYSKIPRCPLIFGHDCIWKMPGKCQDARFFKNSPLIQTLLICGDGHLLSVSDYPPLPWLLPQFRDNGHLTPVQRHYNVRHAFEREFGLL